MADARESLIADFAASLDVPTLTRQYQESGGFLLLPRPLPSLLLAEMVAEARCLLPRAVRKRALFVRKAGALSHRVIVREAPALHALHQSPALLALFSQLTGIELEHRSPQEAHASALYTYTEPGDWMDWHFDECGCPPGDSFSTIIGLIDNSDSRLEVETRGERPDGPVQHQSLQTRPGTFAFFCGSRARHRVTPLGACQERVTFAFTYLRKGRRVSGLYAAKLRLSNALLYFGLDGA